MRASGISELVQKIVNDDFFRIRVIWVSLVINSALVVSGIVKENVALNWVVVRLDFVERNIPSIEKWLSRFFTTSDTGFAFTLAWCFGFYYAALIAKSNPCREDYIRSLIGWRCFMKNLPRVVVCGERLFSSVEFLSAKSCHRHLHVRVTVCWAIY